MKIDLFFGVMGGIFTAIRLVPQVYHSHRFKTTQSLSWYFLIIVLLQSVFLIAYGLYKPDILIWAMNVSPVVCSVWLILLKLRYK